MLSGFSIIQDLGVPLLCGTVKTYADYSQVGPDSLIHISR
jgi:hypothetical protein